MENIFTTVGSLTDEELMQQQGTIFDIERIKRSNNLEDLLKLDINSTEEAVYLIYCLKGTKELVKYLKRMETMIVPYLTKFRTITLLNNSDYYKIILEVCKESTNTELDLLVSDLNRFTETEVKTTSKVFKRLVEYGFTTYELLYLNYLWVGNNVSSLVRARIGVNTINAFGQKESTYFPTEKEIIKDIFNDLKESDLSRDKITSLLQETEEIKLDENWKYIYSLKDTYYDYTCKLIRVYPSLKLYRKRYYLLSEEDQNLMLKYNLVAFRTKESLLEFLESLHKLEYLKSYGIKDKEAIDKLLELGAITLNEIPENLICKHINYLPNSNAFIWLEEHFKSLEKPFAFLFSDYYYNYFNYQKDRINWDKYNDVPDEIFSSLITQIADYLFDNKKDDYVVFVKDILNSKRCRTLLTDQIDDLFECIVVLRNAYANIDDYKLFGEKVTDNYQDIINNVLKKEKDLQDERLSIEKEELLKFFKIYFKGINSLQLLAERFYKYKEDYSYNTGYDNDFEKSLLDSYVKKRIYLLLNNDNSFSEIFFDLLNHLFEKGLISFNDYKKILSKLEGDDNEKITK